MKKKILFVIHSLGGGGAERALVNWLNEIDYDKFDIDLQLFQKSGINLEYVPGQVNILEPILTKYPEIESAKLLSSYAMKQFRFDVLFSTALALLKPIVTNNKSGRFRKFCMWSPIKRYIPSSKKQYDVAIGYMHGLPTYYVVDKAVAYKKYAWMHIDYKSIPKISGEIEYFNKLDKLFTVSQKCADSLNEIFPTAGNIEYIDNINSLKFIEKLASQNTDVDVDNNCVTLLTSGRFTYQKGYDFAIDAAKILKNRKMKFKWYILGDGELKDDMKKQIADNGVGEEFVFLGIKTNPYPYMKNVNIIVQPSRYEGKSVVLDEAKILRKPIVATAYPSVEDQIENGFSGIIVSMDALSIADGICKMAEKNESDKYVANLEKYTIQARERECKLKKRHEDILMK